MTRQECLDAYQDFSRQASANVRQLGLAGVALVWLFKVSSETDSIVLSTPLVWAGIFIISSLFFDFLQYVTGAAVWSRYNRKLEKEGVPLDKKFTVHPFINLPVDVFFWAKVGCTAVGYSPPTFYLSVAGSITCACEVEQRCSC